MLRTWRPQRLNKLRELDEFVRSAQLENHLLVRNALQSERSKGSRQPCRQKCGHLPRADGCAPRALGERLQAADEVHCWTNYCEIQAIRASDVAVNHRADVQPADKPQVTHVSGLHQSSIQGAVCFPGGLISPA